MRHAMAMVRATALVTLLAGCSDNGDDAPSGDGGMDGGGPDGGMDGGPDGSTDAGGDARVDACVPASIADAGSELAAALSAEGVSTALRRAELIALPYCEVYVQCETNAGTAAACAEKTKTDYADALTRQITEACLDAELDLSACIALRDSCVSDQCAAANARCEARLDTRDSLCAPDAGTTGGN